MNTWYYFRNDSSFVNKYVGIDHGSGGYPYYTSDPNSIVFWSTPKGAIEYRDKFLSASGSLSSSDWVLHSIEF